jgi:hypothetical protein
MERTRTVELITETLTGHTVTVCDCGYFERWGLTCRHIFAALKHKPTKWDAQVRWWTVFNYIFTDTKTSEEMRKQILSLHAFSERVQGVITDLNTIPAPVQGTPDIAWFREALSPVVSGQGYWGTPSGIQLVSRAIELVGTSNGIIPFGLESESQSPFRELPQSPFASQPDNSPTNTEALSMHLSPAQRRIESIMQGQGTGISKHLDDLLMVEVYWMKRTPLELFKKSWVRFTSWQTTEREERLLFVAYCTLPSPDTPGISAERTQGSGSDRWWYEQSVRCHVRKQKQQQEEEESQR